MSEVIRVGISTCPNDTFAFHGLMTRRVMCGDLTLEFELLDIEQLNEGILEGRFDVAKASFHLALYVADRFDVLSAGSALGFGVGPLLLSAKENAIPMKGGGQLTLCPGRYTTAAMLFQLFYPGMTRMEHIVFSQIMPALRAAMADFGVCIHEGRFTWREQGLWMVEDLGSRWENEFQSPLPLGGILAAKSIGVTRAAQISRAIQESIRYAQSRPEEALTTMREYAQEFDDGVLMQHVELYVNDWTLELGDVGRSALNQLHDAAKKTGVIPDGMNPLRIVGG
jgi:1,4-dihydroxy-6-naphthoate synthase